MCGKHTRHERKRPHNIPYAAPNRIEIYIDPGRENVCTLKRQLYSRIRGGPANEDITESRSKLRVTDKRYDTTPHESRLRGYWRLYFSNNELQGQLSSTAPDISIRGLLDRHILECLQIGKRFWQLDDFAILPTASASLSVEIYDVLGRSYALERRADLRIHGRHRKPKSPHHQPCKHHEKQAQLDTGVTQGTFIPRRFPLFLLVAFAVNPFHPSTRNTARSACQRPQQRRCLPFLRHAQIGIARVPPRRGKGRVWEGVR